MGRSREAKEASHRHIVDVAADRFREAGIDGVGIADLMAACELTHGGFYRHFQSRDQLVDEAVGRALHKGAARASSAIVGATDPFTSLLSAYLSTRHRDDVAKSCAVATLANDVARSTRGARAAYGRQVETYILLLQQIMGEMASPATRRRGIATLSAVVGALAMSRAVDDPELSRELLDATLGELLAKPRTAVQKPKKRAKRSKAR